MGAVPHPSTGSSNALSSPSFRLLARGPNHEETVVDGIDMLRRRLTVTNALIEASGHPPQLGPPKTTASERTITLPHVVIDAIAAHLRANPAVDGMVWTTKKAAYLRRGSFGRIWRQAIQLTVGPPCRIHDLRHSHAAWLIAAGEHPKAIQTRLGHSSIQVTIDRYGHLMDGLDSQTADRLDAIAESSRGPGVAQDDTPVASLLPENDGNPRNAGVPGLQPRPGSNWRYRLERPAS